MASTEITGERGARVPAKSPSLGQRSRALKRKHWQNKVGRAVMAVVAIVVAAMVTGLVVGGIGVEGVMVAVLAMVAAVFLLLRYPRLHAPVAGDLREADVATLAGQTEIFLESQRPRLPAPAQQLLDRIGGELDSLAPQLQTLRQGDPAAADARRLLGEHLPGLIESYTRIPEPLRHEQHAGSTPEQQLVSGLEVISREIETMTGQIARGELDALATRGRYLETKYVGSGEGGT